MDIGTIIKNRRLELGLTLESVGKAVGVGKSTVRKWESGQIKAMRRDKIAALASVLQLSPAVFIMDSDSSSAILDIPQTKCDFSSDSLEIARLYEQLDAGDRGEIRGTIKTMLRADKYNTRKESVS